MIFFGMIAMLLVVVALAFLRNRWRLVAGVGGGLLGYVLFGTRLAYEFADDARRRGACPDAGWAGPAAGLLRGSLAAVVVFEIVRQIVRHVKGRTKRPLGTSG
jgi:hypothetical protein